MQQWINLFTEKIIKSFPYRVVFIGLQGSRARGEATEESDIDTVVILDEVTAEDITVYRKAISEMPKREIMCGFLSGRREFINWDKADLFQFSHDTIPVYGSLEGILPEINDEDIRRAVKTGACTIYHSCVHNSIYERNSEVLASLYKSARFVITAKHFMKRGEYISRKTDLIAALDGTDAEVLGRLMRKEFSDFDAASALLMEWSGKIIEGKENTDK